MSRRACRPAGRGGRGRSLSGLPGGPARAGRSLSSDVPADRFRTIRNRTRTPAALGSGDVSPSRRSRFRAARERMGKDQQSCGVVQDLVTGRAYNPAPTAAVCLSCPCPCPCPCPKGIGAVRGGAPASPCRRSEERFSVAKTGTGRGTGTGTIKNSSSERPLSPGLAVTLRRSLLNHARFSIGPAGAPRLRAGEKFA